MDIKLSIRLTLFNWPYVGPMTVLKQVFYEKQKTIGKGENHNAKLYVQILFCPGVCGVHYRNRFDLTQPNCLDSFQGNCEALNNNRLMKGDRML